MAEYIIRNENGTTATIETAPVLVFEIDGALQGRPGKAATVAVGNTTTLNPGESATVTNTGTSSAAVLDFGIPKGEKGDQGDPGADPEWGNITGTLSDQTDLQDALDDKYDASNPSGFTNNTGTVTSVSISVPTGLSVSGSPITTSGTFAISLTGGYIIPTVSALAAKLENITGLISAGSNISITGSGTSGSPYVISSSGGGGGGTPGGVDTNLQFNDGGSFGGFGTYDKANDLVGFQGASPSAAITTYSDYLTLSELGSLNTPWITVGLHANFSLAPVTLTSGNWTKTGVTVANNGGSASMTGVGTSGIINAGSTATDGISMFINNANMQLAGDYYSAFYLKVPSGTATVTLEIEDTMSNKYSKTVTVTDRWQRFFVSGNYSTTTAKTARLINGTSTIHFAGHQFDYGLVPRPFVNSTVNSETDIIRLTQNTTVNGSLSITNGISLLGNFVVSRNTLANATFPAIYVYNNTLATVGAPVQVSPAILQRGNVWDTGAAASRQIDWQSYVQPTSGNPGTSNLTWQTQYNAAGFSDKMTLSDSGQLELMNTTANVKTRIDDRNIMFSRSSDGDFRAGIRHNLASSLSYWGNEHNFFGANGSGTSFQITGNTVNNASVINGTSNSSLHLNSDDAAAGSSGIVFNRTNRTAQGNNAINVWRYAGTEVARMTTSGRLGINVTTPSELLDVGGNIIATGYKSSDGTSGATATVDGKVFKNGLYTSGQSSNVVTAASSATPSPTGNFKSNELYMTAQAANAVVAAPSGTPVDGNSLFIRITPTGTYTLGYNPIFEDLTGTAPTGMTNGKDIYIGAKYNDSVSKWQIIAVIVKP